MSRIGYTKNGGKFSASVVPLAGGTAVGSATDTGVPAAGGENEAPPALQRHRLLESGFRVKSKAFMMTFNNRGFTPDTWSLFRTWVLERRAALGARRWAACLEESLDAAPRDGKDDGAGRKVFHLHAYPVASASGCSPAKGFVAPRGGVDF